MLKEIKMEAFEDFVSIDGMRHDLFMSPKEDGDGYEVAIVYLGVPLVIGRGATPTDAVRDASDVKKIKKTINVVGCPFYKVELLWDKIPEEVEKQNQI